MPMTGAGPRGAYGIRISGVAAAETMLVDVRPQSPHLRLVSKVAAARPGREHVTEDAADLVLKTGGRLTVDRERGVACYEVPRRLTDDELIHPFLAPAAAMMAHWHGRLSIHAGAFVVDGAAYGVVGEREAGKSSALAWLALHGVDVVADDVLVIEDGLVHAGPRSIDLRPDTAERFGIGDALGTIGTRERWRVALPQIAGSVPLRGWVFLDWGPEIEARRLLPSACLGRLLDHLTLRMPPNDPVALMKLAGLPAWELRRPRDWDRLGVTTDWLMRVPC